MVGYNSSVSQTEYQTQGRMVREHTAREHLFTNSNVASGTVTREWIEIRTLEAL